MAGGTEAYMATAGNLKKTKNCCGVKKNVYICIVKYSVEKCPFGVHVFDTVIVELNTFGKTKFEETKY